MIALAAGVFAGWRKGFIVPLVVQAGALLSLATLYAGPLQETVPSGLIGIGMGVGAIVLGSSILGAVSGILGAIPADQLSTYDAALGFYESAVRPAPLTSKIAPALLALGEKLPVIGQHVVFPMK